MKTMRDYIDVSEDDLCATLKKHLVEYRKISSYKPKRIDASKLTIVDTILTQLGEVDIGESSDGNFYTVGAIIDGQVEAVLEFRLLGGSYVILTRAVAFIPQKGLSSSLFKWYRKTNPGVGVFSDSQMTPDGEKFWMSLITSYPSKVANLDTKSVHDLSDIDNKVVFDPKMDTRADDLIIDNPNGQVWVYLIEKKIERTYGLFERSGFRANPLPVYEKGRGLLKNIPMSYLEGVLAEGVD
jgi:hypothetical protein